MNGFRTLSQLVFRFFLLLTSSLATQAQTWRMALDLNQATGSGVGQLTVTDMVADTQDNVYLTGTCANPATFGSTTLTGRGYLFFVAKWSNTTHRFVWAQSAACNDGPFQGLQVAVSGNSVYVAGQSPPTITFGTYTTPVRSGYALFVAKFTDTGTSAPFNWVQQTSGDGYPSGLEFAASSAGVYLMGGFNRTLTVGTTTLSDVAGAVFLTKLTDAGTSGRFVWTNQYTAAECTTFALSGTVLYLPGNALRRLTDLGPTSRQDWGLQPAGMSFSRVAVQGSAVYLVGYTAPSVTIGTNTLPAGTSFVAKLLDGSTAGSLLWAQAFGIGQSANSNSALLLTATNTGVYLLSSFNTATFGGNTLNALGFNDVLVAKYLDAGASGSLAWVQSAGGPGRDYPTAVAVVANGTVYTSGVVVIPAAFGPFAFSTGNFITFLATVTDNTFTATTPNQAAAGMALWPNPAEGKVLLYVPAQVAAAGTSLHLTLTDRVGRSVRTFSITLPPNGVIPLTLAGLSPGLYTAQALVGSVRYTQPLVVQ
ncbi:hypothetical protein GO988_23525 [Hymenobacter sp. HMF4947]|uniref:T9SS type A sorting domain-containing protein n=1 Tax=Hymenobacter ginkgonis TaxID=2682976 RepID=A0A7K1TLM5_9BACT|nr:hypothetical protein [Hymenobacter ginkgonis]MVN79314.1 hypothetical protein [Hymenobacter ginkgonis]